MRIPSKLLLLTVCISSIKSLEVSLAVHTSMPTEPLMKDARSVGGVSISPCFMLSIQAHDPFQRLTPSSSHPFKQVTRRSSWSRSISTCLTIRSTDKRISLLLVTSSWRGRPWPGHTEPVTRTRQSKSATLKSFTALSCRRKVSTEEHWPGTLVIMIGNKRHSARFRFNQN